MIRDQPCCDPRALHYCLHYFHTAHTARMVEFQNKANNLWNDKIRYCYLMHYNNIPRIFLFGSNVDVKIQYNKQQQFSTMLVINIPSQSDFAILNIFLSVRSIAANHQTQKIKNNSTKPIPSPTSFCRDSHSRSQLMQSDMTHDDPVPVSAISDSFHLKKKVNVGARVKMRSHSLEQYLHFVSDSLTDEKT